MGRKISEVHKAHRISDNQFTLFYNHMISSFLELGLDQATVQQIRDYLEAMRGEIIKRPATLYERLGGELTVPDAIVRFVTKLRNDKKLSVRF